ncbi:MAG: hypothetical protein GF401_06775 [Chitinivibrionales bacterium]|nr:hypothetical protein [Chitinivibrionales bacterium]
MSLPSNRACIVGLLYIVVLCFSSAMGKTRWSSLHVIPDADLLRGGYFVVDGQGYYFADSGSGGPSPEFGGTFLFKLGIIEWVNIHLGYAGGPTLGFKARVLGETKQWMPSLAVGAHNVFSHKEAHYFGADSTVADNMANEFYCTMAKSLEQLKTRFHLGIQTIPTSESELVNPFFGIEKYFGAGVYTSVEVHRRDEKIIPSLFVSWRLLSKRLQVAAGIFDIPGFLFDNGEFRLALSDPTEDTSLVRPGIWFGIAYNGSLGFGKKAGFTSIDDRLARQEQMVFALRDEVDSLKRKLNRSQTKISSMDQSLTSLVDSIPEDGERIKLLLLDKIITLKSLYEAVPFEPEKVKQAITEIANFREKALPPLKEIILDKTEDRYIRMLSAALLGEIGSKGASDVLLTILSEEEDPGIRIEVLIALGKMKETQAIYLMEQLANDPDDGVALAAQEVLQKLSKETGVKFSSDLEIRDVTSPAAHSVMEQNSFGDEEADIEAPQVYQDGGDVGEDTLSVENATPPELDTVGFGSALETTDQKSGAVESYENSDSANVQNAAGNEPQEASEDIDDTPEPKDTGESDEKKDSNKKKRRGLKKLFGRNKESEKEDPGNW